MIAFFRGNFPSRVIGLLLFYLVLRLPLLLLGVPLATDDLHHMLVGERLAEGFTLYSELYDPTAPLSALFFWLLHLAVGRSHLVLAGLAAILVMLQALRINLLFNRNRVHFEKSYLPALAYVLAGSIFFEFDTLSPMLLGLTFLIFSLSYLTTFSKEGNNSEKLFKGGLMLGFAALCYLPLSWFLLTGLAAIIFFASDAFRSFLLLLVGFLFPYAVACTVFLYTNSLPEFVRYHIAWGALPFQPMALPTNDLILLLTPMLLLLAMGMLRLYSESASLNYRVRFQQLMIIWLIVSVPVVLSGEPVSMRSFAVLLPAVSYFSVLAWSVRKPAWFSELLFALVLGIVIFSRYGSLAGGYRFPTEKIVVNPSNQTNIKGKRILVLGDDLSPYLHNRPATPYIYWPVSQSDFHEPFTYTSLFLIDKNLAETPPDAIIDRIDLMPALQDHLPRLEQYREEEEEGVFVR